MSMNIEKEKYHGFDPGDEFRQSLIEVFGKATFDEDELTQEFYTDLRIGLSDYFRTPDGLVDLDYFWSPVLREWLLHGDQSVDLPLYNLMSRLPPDLDAIRSFLAESDLSSDKITVTAIRFIYEECQYEYSEEKQPEELHSTYLKDMLEVLLEYGLNPNGVYDCGNIMDSLSLVDTNYVAADTMALLLEHGGDLYLTVDDEILFDEIEFDVIFGAHNQEDRMRYDQLIHEWLVMIGFGAHSLSADGDRKEMVRFFEPPYYDELHKDFTIENFKEHRNFYWALTHVPGNGESWSLHIIDKNTGWEVLRL